MISRASPASVLEVVTFLLVRGSQAYKRPEQGADREDGLFLTTSLLLLLKALTSAGLAPSLSEAEWRAIRCPPLAGGSLITEPMPVCAQEDTDDQGMGGNPPKVAEQRRGRSNSWGFSSRAVCCCIMPQLSEFDSE